MLLVHTSELGRFSLVEGPEFVGWKRKEQIFYCFIKYGDKFWLVITEKPVRGELKNFDYLVKLWLSCYSDTGQGVRYSEQTVPRKDNWWTRCPRFSDACREWRLAWLDWSHKRVTIAQTADKNNAGHDKRMSVWTAYSQNSHVDPFPPPKEPTMGMWASELDHRIIEEGNMVG